MLKQRPEQPTSERGPVRRSKDETYRHYRLIVGQRGDGFSSVAYAGKTLVFTGSGCDADCAIDDVKRQIDGDFARRTDRMVAGESTSDDLGLALALSAHRIPATLEHLFDVLHAGTEVTLSTVERRAGADRDTLKSDILRLARGIANVLSPGQPSGSRTALSALNLMVEEVRDQGFTDEAWIFRKAFATAAQRHLDR